MAKILFIHKLWYESIGVMQISAVVKNAGHESYLYMDNGSAYKLIQFIGEIKPDIIGYSIMTGQHHWALETASILKRKLKTIKPLIVFGGPHPTFSPEIIDNEPVDIICRGEGEGAVLDLMNSIENKKSFLNIPNLWVKKNGEIIKNILRPLIKDLDSLPFLDRDLFYKYSYFRDNPNKMVMASRGCPFNCSFCFNEKYRELYNIKGSKIKRRGYQNVIEEIELLKRKYKKTRIVRFHDDIFTFDKEWLDNFLKLYKRKIMLPFMCYIKAGLDDEETIKKLSETGCVGVTFGIETGNENLRFRLLNKKISNRQICHTAYLLKKYKIPFYVNNIFFIPEISIDNVWETVAMNQKIKADYVVASIFQPLPGTSINESLFKTGAIKEGYLNDIKNIYSFSAVKSKNEDIEKNIYYLFYLLVKFPWITPFVKQVIKCRPNILFSLIFKITAGIDYWLRNRLSFARFLREAYHHYDFRG
jgi:radical SAM superfamily enzyme YgiQ (UPF0313 family)